VIAAVVARELAESLSRVGRFDRAIAEPQLTEPTLSWRWCESATSAFVRTPDGGAFTVSPAAGPTLPPELLLALSQAARAGNAPPEVIADRTVDPAWVAGWERASGVPFVAGTRWQWDTQAPGRYASAIDLLDTLRAELAPPASPRRYRVATALGLGAAALVIHVLATFGTWVWGRLDLASADRRLNAIAREAAATDAASLARAHADARHRAGLDASQDAMPLLARAAPALAALPAGSMKAATYAAGAWTLELAPLDEATLAGLDQRLAAAGLSWLHAKSATGVRARITAEP
jgi:hypothetical protein